MLVRALPAARPVRRRAPTAPALFGGPKGGRKPFVLPWHAGLGEFSGDLPYGPAPNYGSPAVEAWRSAITSAAGGSLPVEFLMAWVAIESGGNVCDWETSTGSVEAGIFQLMSPDNITNGQTTLAAQQPSPPCPASSYTTSVPFSALSSEQASAMVQGGINYVNYCVTYATGALATNGFSWDQTTVDFWSGVKAVHVSPVMLKTMLSS